MAFAGTEVTDQATGLTWRRCAEGKVFTGVTCTGTATQFTHEAALQFAIGQRNWRLPNIKELSSIADRALESPALDPSAFPGVPTAGSGRRLPTHLASANAWIVSFVDGGVTYFSRSYTACVLLVRGGL